MVVDALASVGVVDVAVFGIKATPIPRTTPARVPTPPIANKAVLVRILAPGLGAPARSPVGAVWGWA
ncbi:hypothetical protein GCM10011610_00820 [Nocardia rhizosphaerihabitans]|uniref:Uncharacterized protein n=1 Tax=Nocardia rhizosphaerihabitans TaxID=1691570 RepID=A0ABQ2K2K8_9NOCA|nr:hypothetical protein GCM10011610_00820 [Nocardia rhizosphaerihabitans]